MKHFITAFFVMAIVAANAQNTVSISQEADYTHDVYVSMAQGEELSVDATDWDLAFQVNSFFAVGIRINDGRNGALYAYPHSDIDGWDAVDTTGMQEWPALHNGLQIWEEGAFNMNLSGEDTDYGWGEYTGPPDHLVEGDSLYVIQTAAGNFKKMRIDVLDAGVWNFTYANLDGSEMEEVAITGADYPERNFVYYSLDNAEVLDLEPSNASWDLTFTRYFGMTDFGPGGTSGVLANDAVELVKVDGVDVETAEWGDYEFTVDDIGVVGNDWKFLNDQFAWEVVADRCYFVKDLAGDVYKLIFTSFEGGMSGNISYTTEMVSSSSIDEPSTSILGVYPNPGNGAFSLITDTQSAQAQIRVWNMSGAQVAALPINTPGLSQQQVDLTALGSGVYILEVQDAGTQSRTRIIIR